MHIIVVIQWKQRMATRNEERVNNKEENYQEFLRLINNPDYYEVAFDERSGGVSGIHRGHKFDKQIGPFGYRRGEYEKMVCSVLRRNGYRVLLESERSRDNVKNNDGLLNDLPMDIKSVESNGIWSISSKLREAEKQGARVVILYFPDPTLYSKNRVLDGISKYEYNPQIQSAKSIQACMVIAAEKIVDYLKRTTTPTGEWL